MFFGVMALQRLGDAPSRPRRSISNYRWSVWLICAAQPGTPVPCGSYAGPMRVPGASAMAGAGRPRPAPPVEPTRPINVVPESVLSRPWAVCESPPRAVGSFHEQWDRRMRLWGSFPPTHHDGWRPRVDPSTV